MPSRLPLLSCHELTLFHLSLIPPLQNMSLCFYSSLGFDCFVLALVCTECSLPVPLFPELTRSTEIQKLVWPADTADRLWNLAFLSSHLNIVYVILCFVTRIKFLLIPHSASESFSTHTLTNIRQHCKNSSLSRDYSCYTFIVQHSFCHSLILYVGICNDVL